MAKTQAVVLSDIHIGDNSPTCWYQAKYHDPYLTRALDWTRENAETVHELILLGDVFDIWTYPPRVQPPSMKQIIDKNQPIFGPKGPMARVCRALPGQVRMVLGNHDGTFTASDVDYLNQRMGLDPAKHEGIQLLPSGLRACQGPKGGRSLFAHGHHWCMFNAPDPHAPKWAPLPVGHFVTRAISYGLDKKLKPGQTAADLKGMGNPNGVDLKKFLRSYISGLKLDPNIIELLLDYMCSLTGMSKTEPIKLPDGTVTTMQEAKKVYSGLFARWVKAEGTWNAGRAAMADNWAEYLGWFAQRLAMQQAADLVVFGHTHTTVGGFITSPVTYYNSGFECRSNPDRAKQPFSFALVDKNGPSAEICEVFETKPGTYGVRAIKADHVDVVVSPAMDYSCYFRIENVGTTPLTLKGRPSASEGGWVVAPPPVIQPGKRADCWLQDFIGDEGSAGGFTYNDGSKDLHFSAACPFVLARNKVSSAVPNWASKVGTKGWHTRDVDWLGHPLQVRFTVGTPAPAPSPAKAAPRPITAGV